ncbi:hypothetical protein GGR57DRAFT_510796 [Xylariaceae sp. FL1272]|nr:hypothetical protein GGR57DRAFT_510796 [Xylariaceae sp. FL1272]
MDIYFFEMNQCFQLPKLRTVNIFDLKGSPGCNYDLGSLETVGQLRVVNAVNISFHEHEFPTTGSTFHLNNSLSLAGTKSIANIANHNVDLSFVGSIGEHLNITSNSNVAVDLNGLTAIGSSLRITSNVNYNMDSAFPIFEYLETVGNIHVRGFIKSPGAVNDNIFPLLTDARNVTVDSLNPDFYCAQLVSQYKDGKIVELNCDATKTQPATNSSTSKSTSIPERNHNGGLSAGAYVGLGIASGLVLFLAVFTIIWLVRRHNQRLKVLKTNTNFRHNDSAEKFIPWPPMIDGVCEVDGAGILREKPHDPVTALAVTVSELPDTSLAELPPGDVELPADPLKLRTTSYDNRCVSQEHGRAKHMGEEGIPGRSSDECLDNFYSSVRLANRQNHA